MNLLAHCITWNRPELLGRSIHCFLQQTDPNVRLIVLDDAGQYNDQTHERWALRSTSDRYQSMGSKRNAAVHLGLELFPDTDAVMLWDDDDCYFPHTAESVCVALAEKEWAQPRQALELEPDGKHLRRVETHGKVDGSFAYGGCWAFRLDEFFDAGMFEATNNSEDNKLAWKFFPKFGPSANSTPGEPWYYYNRLNNSISAESAMGTRDFYTLRGQQHIEFVGEPTIGWNGPDIFALPIKPGVFPRPW